MSYDSMLLGWTTCHRMVYRQCGNLIFETLAEEENLENPATNPPISKSAIRQSANSRFSDSATHHSANPPIHKSANPPMLRQTYIPLRKEITICLKCRFSGSELLHPQGRHRGVSKAERWKTGRCGNHQPPACASSQLVPLSHPTLKAQTTSYYLNNIRRAQ